MNKLQLLKALAPGFLPLIVFIVADSFWGNRIGLAVAIVFGVGELAASYLKEKALDRFVLFDTGLIVLLGGASLLMKNDLFFRLKPALVEFIFCLILGISVYSPVNIMLLMSRRYLKNISLTREQVEPMMRGLQVLFFVFMAHTLLIVYAAFAMSVRAWGFISGGLFYILFALYFMLEWGRGRLRKRQWLNDEEWFDIVDAEGQVRGKAPRHVCHSQKGFLHQVVHLHLINAEDRLFLQKRSAAKQIQPGKWDTAVGGHAHSGESIEAALKREAREELGLIDCQVLPLARYLWESEVESELVYMFVCRGAHTPRINHDEMDEGKFWKIKKIKENLGKGVFTPNFEFEFAILLKQILK